MPVLISNNFQTFYHRIIVGSQQDHKNYPNQNNIILLVELTLMQMLGKLSSFSLRAIRTTQLPSITPACSFSSDKTWKDRDDAAEKVYISQEQKRTLSKLLHKIQESDTNVSAKEQLFQTRLKEILVKHKITNEAFGAEVLNLHKST